MTEKVKLMQAYEERAQALAEQVTAQWGHVHENDLGRLTDMVHGALVDEANLELRQILASLSGQLELAAARAAAGKPALTAERIGTLLGSIERASALMDVYLDRNAAAKLMLRIDAEAFDLGDALGAQLQALGLSDRVDASIEASPVAADRPKLLDALTHLVTRFYFAARPNERVFVQCARVGERVDGFVGLSPSHVAAEQLMEEMRLPLNVEDVGIDVGYARAVLERHGGSLFVATAGEHCTGFGFSLPALGGDA